ncbi:MAG: transketolase C-terminal domain-containing protein [Propionibacteriaceae bacterium]|nr:transketolase C-terminal domain-containing protein [Propionibacteriaceae bacterium]
MDADARAMEEIQQRVLWLATNMIEHANHVRPNPDGVKVGGHQASCASMVTLMTALYLHHLDADDFVAVKPHGSPVLHALNYLMGNLDRCLLTELRAHGGLQAYPSRTKDPGRVDFSTGSVGLGPAATIFAAATRNYVEAHFGKRAPSRFVALLGDAELDEGNVWEAVHDPATNRLGSVTWLVDFNRQSLDRVVPDMRISPWHAAFEAHGWQVIQLKYGRHFRAFEEGHDAGALREWIDEMPNERYQALFGLSSTELRASFLLGAPTAVVDLLADVGDDEVAALVTDLGGHDLASVIEALEQADRDTSRPTVIFAYTHKGWGLPIQGNARNHAAVLSTEQVMQLRDAVGLTQETQWDRFPEDSPAGKLLAERGRHLTRTVPPPGARAVVPASTSPRTSRPSSTQEAFGRVLVDLSREEAVRPFMVTTSPDVATSTNLAGWINRGGVFAEHERQTWSHDPMLRWLEGPTGQHLELGISEMNFFLLLSQLGLSEHFSGQHLLPVGTVYDPFVCRGLDALIYAVYSGASFVFAGTPSGTTLAPEGGAHQSSITASIGIELPGLTMHEPAYVRALDWLMCDALGRVAAADGLTADSHYFRLTTRPLDQGPFEDVARRIGDETLRRQVLAGAYLLRNADPQEPGPRVSLVGCGAVMPEVLEAADQLSGEGIRVDVVDVPSPGRLYRSWREEVVRGVHTARVPGLPGALRACFPARSPIVTVHDASSHALAWLGGALGTPLASLGVDAFGRSGGVQDMRRDHDLDAGSIVNAALGVMGL